MTPKSMSMILSISTSSISKWMIWALGVKGYHIEKQDELIPILIEAFAHQGPALIDIRISKDERVYPTVPGGKALSDMILGGDA